MPNMQQVIHRAELPLDDRPHGIDLTGELLHAAVRRPGKVDVWYVARPDGMEPMRRSFQIVGTGQPFPTWLGRHHGTAITPDGQFVWHVLENQCEHQNVIDTTEWGQLPDSSGLCQDCHAHLIGDGQSIWTPR
jgi:hypothetical protein